jgi:hypothetical protein
MTRTHSAKEFFDRTTPAVLELKHLATALDAELIGKVTQLTKAAPGLWPLPAPFDEEDRFDFTRESAPLTAWGLPLNQREVQSFSPLVAEAVFGSKIMFLDADADEAFLLQTATSPGQRLATGAWVTRAYQDLPELASVVERTGWVLIPIGPERSLGLFIVSEANASWVPKLAEWCDREGRNRGRFRLLDGVCVLEEQTAPEPHRHQALSHRVDLFLSRLEVYFGEPDEPLLDLLRERHLAKRALREQVERARLQPPA